MAYKEVDREYEVGTVCKNEVNRLIVSEQGEYVIVAITDPNSDQGDYYCQEIKDEALLEIINNSNHQIFKNQVELWITTKTGVVHLSKNDGQWQVKATEGAAVEQ